MKIGLKINLFIIAILFIISQVITIVAIRVFDVRFVDYTENTLNHNIEGIEMTLSDWQNTLRGAASTLAERSDIEQALKEHNIIALNDAIDGETLRLGIDYLFVTDKNGRILAGNIGMGRDASSLEVVKRSLKETSPGIGGAPETFESASWLPYAMLAGMYSNDDGVLYGAVIAGFDIEGDSLKEIVKTSYDAEFTVFEGSKRVATTLSQKLVGTDVNNPAITETVLKKGEYYNGTNIIGGEKYHTRYGPLKNDDGKITGMVFLGKTQAMLDEILQSTLSKVIPIVFVLIILSSVLMFLVIKKILSALKLVNATLADISSGDADLTKRIQVNSKDEIGEIVQNFNAFCQKLQEIISSVKKSNLMLKAEGDNMSMISEDTTSSITQIIANIDSIHSQISSQSSSVDQTAGAVNEISSNIDSLNKMIESQASGIQQASAAVEEMIGNISSVNTNVERMSGSFGELQQNARTGFEKQQNVNDRVLQIENQSEMLEDANKAISDIASQTNLLAMNAAIEAAHAGDAGKGFAVVADEIRKLSETSTTQSKTIGEQLKLIRNSIKDVVQASNESSEALQVVSRRIEDTDQLVIQIRSAMEEQNEGSRQISEALKSMNDSSTEVKTASHEMTEGNKLILDEVRRLQDATMAIKTSMDEMAIGADKINDTGAALGGITNNVKLSIEQIGNQIDLFKV